MVCKSGLTFESLVETMGAVKFNLNNLNLLLKMEKITYFTICGVGRRNFF
jgi:hypothetical protein